MYIKIHKTGSRYVVAVCDEDIIGKKFVQGKLILNISERFYKGDIFSEEETAKLMDNAVNLNIAGKKAINLALKNSILKKENIIAIKGIPHAQVYQIQ